MSLARKYWFGLLLAFVWALLGLTPAAVLSEPTRPLPDVSSGPESQAPSVSYVDGWLDNHLDSLIDLYEELHAKPELSLQEEATSALVADVLRRVGYTVFDGVGGFGVVGILENGPGPTLLLRGDMDALPIVEETGLPYASKVTTTGPDGRSVGVMHACGHDIHITTLLATARLLAMSRSLWSGRLVVIAQPAEELGQGARDMIEDGLFERFPRPDYTLAFHVGSDLPAGVLGYTPGWAMANVDSVDLTFYGRGGHGARPHQAIDPIVAASHFVVALQTLVSRRIDPQQPAVVTVGSFHAGTKHNVIPDEAKLQLTVRSYTDAVRQKLLDGIAQLAADVCQSFQCPRGPQVDIREGYTPAVYNDPDLTARAVVLFEEVFGAENVVRQPPSMGGEDFGRYARKLGVPGLLYRVGVQDPKKYKASLKPGGEALPSVHSSRFAPVPGPTLRASTRSMSLLALELLDPR